MSDNSDNRLIINISSAPEFVEILKHFKKASGENDQATFFTHSRDAHIAGISKYSIDRDGTGSPSSVTVTFEMLHKGVTHESE